MLGLSNISRKFIRNANSQYTSLLQFVWSNIMIPPSYPMPQLALADSFAVKMRSEDKRNDQKSGISSLWDSIIYFAVPKKKISFSRKRQKHDQFIPDKVNWHFCKKCGEPKLPHRICTKFKDICALTTSKWQEIKSSTLN